MSNPLHDVRCPECDGIGIIPCEACDGEGKTVQTCDVTGRAIIDECPACEGDGGRCETCQGSGEVTRDDAKQYDSDMCAP